MSVKDKKLNKNKDDDYKEFSLTEVEYVYLKGLAKNRNDAWQAFQNTISSFLAYLAGTKWGFSEKDLLNFQFDEEKKSVKIKKLKEE